MLGKISIVSFIFISVIYKIPKDEYNKFSDDKKKEYFMYSGKILKKCNRMWNYSVVDDRL